MKITERRVVHQMWYEVESSKTGWEGDGWSFLSDDKYLEDHPGWKIMQIIESDKFGNSILGVAEREIEIP